MRFSDYTPESAQPTPGELAKNAMDLATGVPARRPAHDALDRLAASLPPRGMTSTPEFPTKPAEANALHAALATVRERLDALTAQVEQLREERDAALESSDEYERQANRTLDRAVAAEAEVQRYREGLRRIEWIDRGEGYDECAYCEQSEASGHTADCPLDALLAIPDGAKPEGGEA